MFRADREYLQAALEGGRIDGGASNSLRTGGREAAVIWRVVLRVRRQSLDGQKWVQRFPAGGRQMNLEG